MTTLKGFDPSEPRDADGKWTTAISGANSGNSESMSGPQQDVSGHQRVWGSKKEAYERMKGFKRVGWEEVKKGGEGAAPHVFMHGGGFVIRPEAEYKTGDISGYQYSNLYVVSQMTTRAHGKALPRKFSSIDDAADFAEARYKVLADQGQAKKPNQLEADHPLRAVYERAEAKALADVGPMLEPDKPRLPDGRPIPPGYMICPKCAGYGFLPSYGHVAEGICFKCGGSGVVKLKKSLDADLLKAMAIEQQTRLQLIYLAARLRRLA